MERRVHQLFNTKILKESAHLYGTDANSAVLLSDMENFVFSCGGTNEPIIVRITHYSHRQKNALLGELDWMTYLSDGGIPLATPLHSIRGNLVEEIGSGEAQFAVTAFPKLPGQPILEAGECTPQIFQQWGRVMGRMHALTKNYYPSYPSYRRSSWFENDILFNVENYIPGQAVIQRKLQSLMQNLQVLPQDSESYGLVHRDFTDVNFFVHDHRIAVFDFDDSEYHWFIYDIAVVLFDSLPFLPHLEMDEASFGGYFWQHYYRGYTQENTLDKVWLERLPHFMKLSQIYMYIWFHKKWDLESLTKGQQRVLSKYRRNIENDIPCLEFDPIGNR
jgi:Ser/Thr protein kinase RdoA (MazF antagonist)